MLTSLERENKIFWVYIFGFFISLQYAVVTYSASTFLSEVLSQSNIWIIYSLGSLVAILLNFSLAGVLKKINLENYVLITILLAIVSSVSLATVKSFLPTSLEYIFYYGLSTLIFTLASVILEEFSKDNSTGGTRGKYNAICSGGFLLAPFIASIFIIHYGIQVIFILSAIFSVIALFIFYTNIYPVPRVHSHNGALLLGLKKILRSRDLTYITLAQFGLTLFFVLVVVYLPFKLTSLGIPLTQYLSIILPVALSPFLFMPPLLGYIEDQMRDEKEVLIMSYIGLIIIITVIAFLNSSSVLVWTLVLFLSRLCASSTEISTNSYFYKKINKDDVALISVFISCEGFATILFTPIFSLLLYYTDITTLFLSVSFFLCFVLVLVSKIHDTKNHQKHQDWKKIWHRSKKRAAS